MRIKFSSSLQGALMLALAAFFWGTAFVAQRVGMDAIEPVTFTAVRSFVGVAVLLPVVLISDINAGRKPFRMDPGYRRRDLAIGGIACGVVLAVAANLQQVGIAETSAGKSGFITALYIVLVPVFGLFLKKKTPVTVWISVAIALAGMYLLCIKAGDSFALSRADVYLLLCAACFTVHILVVDWAGSRADGVRLSCIQFATCGAISAVICLLTEHPTVEGILAARVPLLYTGLFSCGLAYTLQILGQKRCPPQIASLLMSMESVFAALGGFFILHERMSAREFIGCLLVFSAVILTQLPDLKKRPKLS